MKAVVPIIGHEHLGNSPHVKLRAEFLLQEKGYEVNWVDEASITQLQTSSQTLTYIPFIINLHALSGIEDHVDIVNPLALHFSTSPIISATTETLSKILYEFNSALFGKKKIHHK
jgi:hypothetical protein